METGKKTHSEKNNAGWLRLVYNFASKEHKKE
jgi:hypothetical protein